MLHIQKTVMVLFILAAILLVYETGNAISMPTSKHIEVILK